MFWDTENKRYFNKNYRNLKTPSTEGMPDPNDHANAINSGRGAFNDEITPTYPKRKRNRRLKIN